jgi:hypothetical protein
MICMSSPLNAMKQSRSLPINTHLIHFAGVAGPRAYSMSQAGASSKQIDFQVRIIPGGTGTQKLFTMPLGERFTSMALTAWLISERTHPEIFC